MRLADFLLYPTMQTEKSERSERGIVASCENANARGSSTGACAAIWYTLK